MQCTYAMYNCKWEKMQCIYAMYNCKMYQSKEYGISLRRKPVTVNKM